jgi:hypothetical protein
MLNGVGSVHDEARKAMNGEAAQPSSSCVTVHVEARLKSNVSVNLTALRVELQNWLEVRYRDQTIVCECVIDDWRQTLAAGRGAEIVDRLRICEASDGQPVVVAQLGVRFLVHLYYAASADDIEELMTSDADGAGEDAKEDEAMAATVLELPNAGLEGVWETLIYANGLKTKLMNYIYATLRYSDVNVDANLISCNRLVLLHGPPGTGKTSLCRALSHKLAVRLGTRYAYGKLVEINAHSLFSKWFSESGKLVQRLFSMINEMVADQDALIVVLIDEVESLTAARSNASSGAEPGDAVRVVNALLTQLDRLKQRKNVLVLTTSNLSDTVDNAFLDRADVKQYVGPPPPEAIYWILQSCAQELMRVGLVAQDMLLPWHEAHAVAANHPCRRLVALAVDVQGLSGRTLRRLPVLAHARSIGHALTDEPISFDVWLTSMQAAAQESRIEIQDANLGSRKTNA